MSIEKGDAQKNMESMEYLARGEKGEQGSKGERGARGLSRRVAWAIVVLFLVGAGVETANLVFTAHEVNAAAAAQRQQQASQQRQGELLEARLCATLEPLAGLAGLRPPAGNPSDNPSRAYEQELSAKLAPLAQLGPDLGCGKGGPR